MIWKERQQVYIILDDMIVIAESEDITEIDERIPRIMRDIQYETARRKEKRNGYW